MMLSVVGPLLLWLAAVDGGKELLWWPWQGLLPAVSWHCRGQRSRRRPRCPQEPGVQLRHPRERSGCCPKEPPPGQAPAPHPCDLQRSPGISCFSTLLQLSGKYKRLMQEEQGQRSPCWGPVCLTDNGAASRERQAMPGAGLWWSGSPCLHPQPCGSTETTRGLFSMSFRISSDVWVEIPFPSHQKTLLFNLQKRVSRLMGCRCSSVFSRRMQCFYCIPKANQNCNSK